MKDYFDKYNDCTLAAPLTLEQANLKYKGVASIVCNIHGLYYVYDEHGVLCDTCEDLQDAIQTCRDIDNAEPADRQF